MEYINNFGIKDKLLVLNFNLRPQKLL